jgi:hypothetical protein
METVGNLFREVLAERLALWPGMQDTGHFRFFLKTMRIEPVRIQFVFDVFEILPAGQMKILKTETVTFDKGLEPLNFLRAEARARQDGTLREFYRRFVRWLKPEEKITEILMNLT